MNAFGHALAPAHTDPTARSGNFYGTSFEAVDTVKGQGRICLLDIDLQGVQSVKQASFDAAFIMLVPPSMEELERRLRSRGDTSPRSVERRLERAKAEMAYREMPDFWDAVVVNDDLAVAEQRLREAIDAAQEAGAGQDAE